MFKVKNIKTKEIIQVLDTMVDDIFGVTFFLFGKIMVGDGALLKIISHLIMNQRKVKFDFPLFLCYNKRK